MKRNNHTKYAILGLLATGFHTGYNIKQMIDNSLNHFWKISYGQIYPTLKVLVEEGLATVEDKAQEGKPDKKEYYLTSKGGEALRRWLESPLDDIPVSKNEVLLKLFFSRNQTNTQTINQLESYKEILEERYAIYSGIEESIKSHDSMEPDAKFWFFTLDYGKRITSAEIDWCQHTIHTLIQEED
ncbi:PadR family transcriptional regulator [Ornithinibacillus xuwenensis]|uniref:PadR family transcriptional regulator n=1 Tax=Ornithinibacillus xuwenensis TaxID=3144668 RepID=A0ABU9XFI8_9BACI